MIFQAALLQGDGKVQRCEIEAATKNLARQMLSGRGRVLSLIPRTPVTLPAQVFTRLRQAFGFSTNLDASIRLKPQEVANLCGQLSGLLNSSVSLTDALDELTKNATTKRTASAARVLRGQIESGSSVEAALGLMISNATILQMISIGEASGTLGSALATASEHLTKSAAVRGQVYSSLAYPAIVAFAALGVAAYLVTTAVPQLSTVISASGRDLPRMTQTLLWAYDGIMGAYRHALLISAGCVTLLWWVRTSPQAKRQLHRIALRLPILGKVIRMRETQAYAASLASLIGNGMPLQEAIQGAIDSLNNLAIKDSAAVAANRVRDGESAADALDAQACFAFPFTGIIRVGERTGQIQSAAVDVAKTLEQSLYQSLQRAVRIIEPVLIVTVGSVVGYVYIAFLLALMTASGGLK